MNYISVSVAAKKWNISERSVRNYCAQGRVNGAFLTGKTWNIPENAEKPERINKKNNEPQNLLDRLKMEKSSGMKGGIYHKLFTTQANRYIAEASEQAQEPPMPPMPPRGFPPRFPR